MNINFIQKLFKKDRLLETTVKEGGETARAFGQVRKFKLVSKYSYLIVSIICFTILMCVAMMTDNIDKILLFFSK